MLHDLGSSWLDTARLLLRGARQLGYDKQFLLLNRGSGDIRGLSPFCSSVLQAWQVFGFKQPTSEIWGLWLFKEPLFFSNFLTCQMLQSASLRTSLLEAGCTGVGHLLRARDSLLHLLRTRINSTRL